MEVKGLRTYGKRVAVSTFLTSLYIVPLQRQKAWQRRLKLALIGQYLKTHFQSPVPFLSRCEEENTEKLLGSTIKKIKIKTINTESLLTLTHEKNLTPSLVPLLLPSLSPSFFPSSLPSLIIINKGVSLASRNSLLRGLRYFIRTFQIKMIGRISSPNIYIQRYILLLWVVFTKKCIQSHQPNNYSPSPKLQFVCRPQIPFLKIV